MVVYDVIGHPVGARLRAGVFRRLHLDGAVGLPAPLLAYFLDVVQSIDPGPGIARECRQGAAVVLPGRGDAGLSRLGQVMLADQGDILELAAVQFPALHEGAVRPLGPGESPAGQHVGQGRGTAVGDREVVVLVVCQTDAPAGWGAPGWAGAAPG